MEGDVDLHLSNTWFTGPTRVHNPEGISIGSAIFAVLTSVTDQLTDRQTTLLGMQGTAEIVTTEGRLNSARSI